MTTQVKTLEHLEILSAMGRAVVLPQPPCWSKPRPAAFVINLPGAVILRMILAGLFVYEVPGKAYNRLVTITVLR